VSAGEKDRALSREILIDSSGIPESAIHHRLIVRSAHLIRYTDSLDVGLVVTSTLNAACLIRVSSAVIQMQYCRRGTA
jgi:hypothetical protein